VAGCQKGHNTHRAGHLKKTEQTNTRNAMSVYIKNVKAQNTAQTNKKQND